MIMFGGIYFFVIIVEVLNFQVYMSMAFSMLYLRPFIQDQW